MTRMLTPFLMLTAGLVLGLLSAAYIMQNASGVAAVGATGWNELRLDGEDVQSTYLSGHFLSLGEVPPPKGTRFLVRNVDDDGQSLRGNCVVSVEGKMPNARWWFLAAASGSARSTLDVAQAVREANGEYSLSVSATPVPGNWLVPPSGDGYQLQLVLLGVDAGEALTAMPRVRRLWCL